MFTTESLIAEVEKRPAIWDMRLPEYSDRNARRKCWEEITALFSNSDNEKEKIATNELLQKKWKNIRDRYSRELSERVGKSGDGTKKRTPYMYGRQLEFLRDTMTLRKTSNSLVLSDTPTATGSVEEELMDGSKPPPPKKMRRGGPQEMDRKIIQILEKNRVDREAMEDADRLFLLSLLPALKSVHPNFKFDTKIQLMQLIQNMPKANEPVEILEVIPSVE